MPEIVYTDTIGYPEKRNIVDLPHKDFVVEKRLNAFRFPNALYFKYYNASNSFFLNSHYEPVKRNNLHHFFNTISFGEAPWITTFETLLPRWGKVPAWLERKGVELLAGKNCKKLIAISECTKHIQSLYLDAFPDLKEEILAKTIVLHPPQQALIKDIEDKHFIKDGIINLLLIGNQICSKGGREAVKTVIKLHKEGAPVKLTIISAMEPDSYASYTMAKDIDELKKLIANNSNCIQWVGRQPYNYVLNALVNADVVLLPTYADTYGYAVLEAQAAGCPVITTDIRALPEINNSNCGWIMEVPKDEKGNGKLVTKSDRNAFPALLEEGLYKVISSIIKCPDVINEKGSAAFQRIATEHNPAKAASILSEIYKSV